VSEAMSAETIVSKEGVKTTTNTATAMIGTGGTRGIARGRIGKGTRIAMRGRIEDETDTTMTGIGIAEETTIRADIVMIATEGMTGTVEIIGIDGIETIAIEWMIERGEIIGTEGIEMTATVMTARAIGRGTCLCVRRRS
jgi:hypothetical protein